MNTNLAGLVGWLGVSAMFLSIFLYCFLFMNAELTPILIGLTVSVAGIIAPIALVSKAKPDSTKSPETSVPPAEQPAKTSIPFIVTGETLQKQTLILDPISVKQLRESFREDHLADLKAQGYQIIPPAPEAAKEPVDHEEPKEQTEKKPEPIHFLVHRS